MTERMWRVVAVYRVVTMIYAAALIIRDHDQYAHPAGGIAILAVIIFWTSVTVVAYSRPGGRQRWLIVADVIVTAALVYSTRWVDTPSRIAHGFPTLPSFWAASPVLACAVAFGPWVGITAALVISGSDYAERPQLSLENPFSNIVLLLIAGGIGGYIVRLGLQAEEAVARVARKEAAIAERERLARDIHDSVLQVLTRVSSRGRALGGEAAELGHMAAEQESALRRLITGTAPGPTASLAGIPGTDALRLATPEGGAAGMATASGATADPTLTTASTANGEAHTEPTDPMLTTADSEDGGARTERGTRAPETVATGSLPGSAGTGGASVAYGTSWSGGTGGTGVSGAIADEAAGAVAGGRAISPGIARKHRSVRGLWATRGLQPGRRLGKAGLAQAAGSRDTAKAARTEGSDEAAGTRGTSTPATAEAGGTRDTAEAARTEGSNEAAGAGGTARGTGTQATAEAAGTRGTARGTSTPATAEAAGTRGTARGTGTPATAEAASTRDTAKGTAGKGSARGTSNKRTGTKTAGIRARAAKAAVQLDGTDQPVDLRELIERFADPQVTVSCPASPVPLPTSAAGALSGATAAALDNVRQHAGADAHAWVLVEDTGETVQVSIRDNGTGFADGRLAKAAAAGRLGVSHSIIGRLREVGGTAWVTSAPGQGTEVELAVPRTAQRTGPSGPRPHRGRSSDLA
jgi:signal transduction histidine kinase